MTIEDDPYRLLVVSDGKEAPASSEIPSIMMAPRLTDELVLECIAATASRERCSLPEAIQMLVSENILQLGIPDGRNMVLPISGVIQRMVWDTSHSALALGELAVSLSNTSGSRERMEMGLLLGDRAAHFAAGFIGNRMLGRVMKPPAQRTYARDMAQLGYSSAIHAASRVKTHEAKSVQDVVPKILARFGDVISILTSMSGKHINDFSLS